MQRRFELHRDVDVSGVSGTGVVADGVQYTQPFELETPGGNRVSLAAGWCMVTWRGEHQSTVLWPSIDGVRAVHGHTGATRIVWLDPPLDPGRSEELPHFPHLSAMSRWDNYIADDGAVHSIPRHDIVEHAISDECVYGPRVESVFRGDGSCGWTAVHHSLDGREFAEADRVAPPWDR